MRTATDVLEEYKFNNIDFISIDVENLEEQVLKSIDFKKFRPKVILIEAID